MARRARLAGALIALGAVLLPAGTAQARPGDARFIFGPVSQTSILGLAVSPADGSIVVAGASEEFPPGHPADNRGWVLAFRSDGERDRGFSADGVAELQGDGSQIADAVVQPGGHVLVAVGTSVQRLTPSGAADPTFGTANFVQLFAGTPSTLTTADLAQSNGGFVAVGLRRGERAVFVERYLANGTPDPGFGSGGRATFDAGAPVTSLPHVVPQPSGALLLSMMVDVTGDPRLLRLTPGGALDDSFGPGGATPRGFARLGLPPRVPGTLQGGGAPAVLPNGRIRVPLTYRRTPESARRIALLGLTRNGLVERRYGRRGFTLGPGGSHDGEGAGSALADRARGVVVAGDRGYEGMDEPTSHAVLRRFRARGAFDRSFGDGGTVRGTDFDPDNGLVQRLALVDADTVVGTQTVHGGRYPEPTISDVRLIDAAYDRRGPRINIRAGCRAVGIRATDPSGIARVVVRFDGRAARRTAHRRLRVRRPPDARRVSVRATDLAGNSSVRRRQLPRC